MRRSISLWDKAVFYITYFYKKAFCLWFEVKRPRLRMFLYEMAYSARKFLDYKALHPSPFDTDMVETVFGKFRIRPRTVDMSNVSPAFERRDVDYMFSLMERLVSGGKKVLFLDIGADIGTFTVTVGNRFGGVDIASFEPAPESFGILGENVSLNGISRRVALHNFALYSENTELEFDYDALAPGSSGLRREGSGERLRVPARTLDSAIMDRVKDYDYIVIKMDVEGAEVPVLKGAAGVLASGKEIYMIVEDFIDPSVIDYLEGICAEFMAKVTPYNSWWRYRKAG